MPPPVDVVVVGAGGHAREIADIAGAVRTFRVVGFVADNPPLTGDPAAARYLGRIDDLREFADHYALAIGDSAARSRVAARLDALDATAVTIAHPASSIGSDVVLGDGGVLFPGARITVDAVLGRHCHLNVNASVSHDCRLGDFVTVSPGSVVCGTVRIGNRSYVGANACIRQNLTIGDDVLIGAGATVTRSLLEPGIYVGCPARPIEGADR